MKAEKLIHSFLHQRSSGGTKAMTVLVGGLAVGAVLGVMFATQTGRAARKKIRNAIRGLFQGHQKDDLCRQASPARHPQPHKRPKSDIRAITQQGHVGAFHTEQSVG